MEEVSELREFYDPDTVELMNWIRSVSLHSGAWEEFGGGGVVKCYMSNTFPLLPVFLSCAFNSVDGERFPVQRVG